MIACRRDTMGGKAGRAALSRNNTDSWSGPDLIERSGFATVHGITTGIHAGSAQAEKHRGTDKQTEGTRRRSDASLQPLLKREAITIEPVAGTGRTWAIVMRKRGRQPKIQDGRRAGVPQNIPVAEILLTSPATKARVPRQACGRDARWRYPRACVCRSAQRVRLFHRRA